jgi:type IV fimbrial biogenesis protein FimT
MRQNGFSLVELIVVLVIITTLLAIATLQFNNYTRKSNIEKQVRTMYTDVLTARSQALLQKKSRAIMVTATQFSVYSSVSLSGPPLQQTTLQYPVNTSNIISFDSRGVAHITAFPYSSTNANDPVDQTTLAAIPAICVSPVGNPAACDSIIINATNIQMGKWNGGACNGANVTAK